MSRFARTRKYDLWSGSLSRRFSAISAQVPKIYERFETRAEKGGILKSIARSVEVFPQRHTPAQQKLARGS